MSINDRITKVIEFSKLTPSEFADEIDVQRSSISHIISGRNKPSLEFVTKVKQAFPELEWNWIITGEEPMLIIKEDLTQLATEEFPKKRALPDLFALIDNDKFGEEKVDENLTKNAVSDNTSNFPSPKQSANNFDTDDSQRLENTPITPIISPKKSVKRVVFFYEDGTFEAFEN